MKYVTVTLGSGNLKQAVVLPDGEDLNEWVAANSKITLYFSKINSNLTLINFQLLIFSIKLTCFMEQLLNFVQNKPVK